jgi:hypothetical protein
MTKWEYALYDIADQTEWEIRHGSNINTPRFQHSNSTGPALILLLLSSVPVRNRVVTFTLTEEQSIDM